ncbi:hypothetical protein EPN44_09670 [bacterium]|nr:MAG: hypothetical protein EPN44_09670 [bacterium]
MHNPNVPETLHGWSILHRLYAFDRRRWSDLTTDRQAAIQSEALRAFERLEGDDKHDLALCQVLGGKGDLMFIHYARDFEALAGAEMLVSGLEINDYLQPRYSYVSVLEVGRHRATARIHEELRERGLEANSAEWVGAFDQAIAEETAAVAARLWAEIPRRRFWCFYPSGTTRGTGTRCRSTSDAGSWLRMERGRKPITDSPRRLSPARPASTTGSGELTSFQTIRWSSRGSSTSCASTK